MQLKTKSKGSLNCVGVIKSNDKRAKKYRAIWRENGKQKSKGFENYEDAIKFRKYIEIELINDYVQELETQLQELNDDAIWWSNRFKTLGQENKQLKEEIKQAREFIEEWCTINPTTGKCVCYLDKNRCTELYKILGGKEND